jgi:hypothetical protein
VAVVKALELALALIALVTLPCAIAAMIMADEIILAARAAVRSRRDRWAEHRILHHMERSLAPPRAFLAPVTSLLAPVSSMLAGVGSSGPRHQEPPAAPDPAGAAHPPFERIAADLRRLGADRLGIGQRNDMWHTAVERAYDVKLREACHALSIGEHLDELEGIDREIERLRVEGELIAAGVLLR